MRKKISISTILLPILFSLTSYASEDKRINFIQKHATSASIESDSTTAISKKILNTKFYLLEKSKTFSSRYSGLEFENPYRNKNKFKINSHKTFSVESDRYLENDIDQYKKTNQIPTELTFNANEYKKIHFFTGYMKTLNGKYEKDLFLLSAQFDSKNNNWTFDPDFSLKKMAFINNLLTKSNNDKKAVDLGTKENQNNYNFFCDLPLKFRNRLAKFNVIKAPRTKTLIDKFITFSAFQIPTFIKQEKKLTIATLALNMYLFKKLLEKNNPKEGGDNSYEY
ncbi:hypothetical protein KAH94_01255 [bacterium]|nr:hypothetical protein [bacterium]